MVEFFEADKREVNRKSSKGNQLKFERNGIWYKADYTGYEGLSEFVASHLMLKSTMTTSEFVLYNQEELKYKNRVYMGVSSEDLLNSGEQLITLERLFTNTYGVGLSNMIYGISDHKDRLRLIVSKTEELTGLTDFGVYMSKMMAIDAFFLNEDRHTHNIAVVLCPDGSYRYCPYFDHGAGFLADTTMDYPLDGDVYDLMESVQAKTFCQDFDEQLDIAERLYGKQLEFKFDKKYVDKLLDRIYGYEDRIVERVRNIIYEQMRRYTYMCK
ncbi:hypothetical protein [Butyrivibrio sp. AD3002]|uniref:hypothetical protein n=1 Tax=Butyrivibrio sp. AD3002 TaxID=1280670 RepID=UPI0003B5D20F|nr:hypothetical protein [Butyrivibrio sp. AD3002]